MIKQTSLLSELRSIVGKKHAREPEDERAYAVDGLSPQAVVEPGTYEEVVEVLRFANAERLALIPRGSGFHMHIGNLPSRYDIALSLVRLDKIIEHEPADMTVTCQAGVTIGRLQEHLSKSGQMVPFTPNRADRSTIGSLLALNEGQMRLAYGAPRDFTIGLRVATVDGHLTKAGGKVVKNVAGYDLCKLYIGSLGTLGVIVEATFKLFPIPVAQERVDLEFPSIRDASDFVAALAHSGLAVTSIHASQPMRPAGDRFAPAAGFIAAIRFSGTARAVERSSHHVMALAAEKGIRGFDLEQLPEPGGKMPEWTSREFPLLCQASILPATVPALAYAFEQEAPGPFITADLAGGLVSGEWLGAVDQTKLVERLRAATRKLGGSLVVRGCSPELKREIDVFGQPPPSFPLMRAIKQQFDPNNVLSPGRFVGRL